MRIERVAMIGTRGHYRTVLREMQSMPALRVVALCDGGDSVAPIAAWCRENGHTPKTFEDHRAMLDGARPELLVIDGPFESHALMCIEAVKRGVHVITEKPAALTFAELDALSTACEQSPTVLLAGMMFSRYDAGFWTAKQLISSGAIGD